MNPADSLQPNFLRAWRGIWLFTWRSQITQRKLPLIVLGLLVLPVLVYVVTAPRLFAKSSRFTDPNLHYRNFARDLGRAKMPLTRPQESQLRQIFAEGFRQAQNLWEQRMISDANADDTDLIKPCYENILSRAQAVLDERQFTQFQAFGSQYVRERLERSSDQRWTQPTAFYYCVVYFYFLVLVPLNCVRLCGALIRDELQSDTLSFLTTRPLTRAQLILAKFLSQTAWLQIVLLAETLLLFAAGIGRHIPNLGGLLPLLLATQFLAVFAWSAIGLFLGLVSNRYMAIALVYGLIVELGIGNIPTNVNTLSIMTHLRSLLSRNEALQNVFDYAHRAVPFSVGALLIATVIFVTLAAALFTFREYHHTAEMQK